MLQYMGHPLVDVGIATITAFSNKADPSEITEEDLGRVADFIEQQYTVQPLKSFLTVAFMNSGFTQPAFEKQPEKRQLYAQKVARNYLPSTFPTADMCVFSGEPVSNVSWSVDESLPAGRAFREHIPLLTGRGVINFLPGGDAGLRVSGKAMLCIQFFPMGSAKCGGRLLTVHSDNPDIIWFFAKQFLDANRSALLQAQAANSTKLPESHRTARTLLIETLLHAETQRADAQEEARASTVTAYHLSSSGQSNPLDNKNPPLTIYHLPLQITGFLATVAGPDFRQSWNSIAQRAWQLAPQKKKGKSKAITTDEPFIPRFNHLYEDLFQLPDQSPRFVRTYFLRIPRRNGREDDPTRQYNLGSELKLVDWKLVQLFLRKVVHMGERRINEIRVLGDRLAGYIHDLDDKRFFRNFFRENKSQEFRAYLIKANLTAIRAGQPPLFGLDPYITVFEEGDEVIRSDWRFARDLVLIRMIEQLYASGWIGKNPDLVAEATNQDDEDSTKS